MSIPKIVKAMTVCLCIVVGIVALILYFNGNLAYLQPGEIATSEKTTAKVSNGYDGGATSNKGSLEYLTEEEMFAQENMYVFRGRVSGLKNVTIDFNGEQEGRCIATVLIEKVYKGNLTVGDQINMLIPCAIDLLGSTPEDTGVISQLKSGMDGIFMPWVYDEKSRIEMNGAVLMYSDLALCGLVDGMRWAFLSTDKGVVFERNAYSGIKNAINLDEVEKYVMEMLK